MSTIPPVTSNVTATQTSGSTSSTGVDKTTIANNFQTFLTLLTTQLKNQNPLDPLDTNQFTQQLVQFAQVEQQIKQNDQLETLVDDREGRAVDDRARLSLAQNVAVDGQTAKLADNTGDLDLPGAEAGERHRHHQEQHRADRLYRQLLHDDRHPEFRLGRPRQQRRQMAGRQLHDRSRRQGRQWAGRADPERGAWAWSTRSI